MRNVYIVVVVLGVAAILVDHLSSPSSGRAVSPEDFASYVRRESDKWGKIVKLSGIKVE